jgi:hypothetical protein
MGRFIGFKISILNFRSHAEEKGGSRKPTEKTMKAVGSLEMQEPDIQ